MSGYYPDGLDQASYDRYWDKLLDYCEDCESNPCQCDTERHSMGCPCPDCAGAELTAEND